MGCLSASVWAAWCACAWSVKCACAREPGCIPVRMLCFVLSPVPVPWFALFGVSCFPAGLIHFVGSWPVRPGGSPVVAVARPAATLPAPPLMPVCPSHRCGHCGRKHTEPLLQPPTARHVPQAAPPRLTFHATAKAPTSRVVFNFLDRHQDTCSLCSLPAALRPAHILPLPMACLSHFLAAAVCLRFLCRL